MFFPEDRRYEYFLKTAEYRNFTKAAEKLYVSQPSLSKFISQLEKELNTPLFIRKRELELTEAGKLYRDYILSIYKLQNDFQENLTKIINRDTRTFRLGITPWRAMIILPKLISKMAETMPYVNIEITEEPASTLAQGLIKGKLDMFITVYSKSIPEQNLPGLKHELLYKDILLALVDKKFVPANLLDKANNKKAFLTQQEFSQFGGIRLINSKHGRTLYQRTLDIVKKYNINPPSMIETANIDNAINLAESGYGITFIPRSYLRNHGRTKDNLCCFEIEDELFIWNPSSFYFENADKEICSNIANIIKDIIP